MPSRVHPRQKRHGAPRALRGVGATARAWPGFVVAVGLALAAAGFNATMVAFMAAGLSDLLPGPFAEMGHFSEAHHRTHDVTFGLLFLPSVAGLLAQLRRPARNIAGMCMTLAPPAALLVVLGLTFLWGGDLRVLQPPWITVMAGALLALALHPAGRVFMGSFRRTRASRPMLALVAVAIPPSLAFASIQARLQISAADDHAAAGHYGFMAAFALTVIALGTLAGLRPDGWRLAAWTTAALPLMLAATSMAYPQARSSLTSFWALTAAGWSVLFCLAALFGNDGAWDAGAGGRINPCRRRSRPPRRLP